MIEGQDISKDDIQRQIDTIAKKCAQIKPLLVISCITYNHEPYLRDALEGFVMQKTDFPVVAVVHDDASTDSTADILREYAQRYPDIILPIYETENQYSKHDGSLGRVIRGARGATGAKYIALCEGDDYWTDPHKLQKQVDFLESHPDYAMCCHRFTDYIEVEDRFRPKPSCDDYEINFSDIYDGNIQCATVILRKSVFFSEIYKKLDEIKKCPFGDYKLFFSALSCGKGMKFKDVMSVYRIHPGSAISNFSKCIDDFLRSHKEIAKILGCENLLDKHLADIYLTNLAKDFKNKNYFNYVTFKIWSSASVSCTKRLLKFVSGFVKYKIQTII